MCYYELWAWSWKFKLNCYGHIAKSGDTLRIMEGFKVEGERNIRGKEAKGKGRSSEKEDFRILGKGRERKKVQGRGVRMEEGMGMSTLWEHFATHNSTLLHVQGKQRPKEEGDNSSGQI